MDTVMGDSQASHSLGEEDPGVSEYLVNTRQLCDCPRKSNGFSGHTSLRWPACFIFCSAVMRSHLLGNWGPLHQEGKLDKLRRFPGELLDHKHHLGPLLKTQMPKSDPGPTESESPRESVISVYSESSYNQKVSWHVEIMDLLSI